MILWLFSFERNRTLLAGYSALSFGARGLSAHSVSPRAFAPVNTRLVMDGATETLWVVPSLRKKVLGSQESVQTCCGSPFT